MQHSTLSDPKESVLNQASVAGKVTLNADQKAAYEGVLDFILSDKNFMVIEGGPGTGKSTMIEHIYRSFPEIQRLQTLMGAKPLDDIILTATTHKATAVISEITGAEVGTIQSLLGLRLHTDYSSKPVVSKLVPSAKSQPIHNMLIIVDEMSYIDKAVNAHLKNLCRGSKVILVGDYEQILGVREKFPVIKTENYTTHSLTHIERRGDIDGATHPITQMGYSMRGLIQGNPWVKTPIDGKHLVRAADPDEFEQLIISEFGRPDWKSSDSRIIAWKNDTVQMYNGYVQQLRSSDTFSVGDIVVSNKFTKTPQGAISNNAEVVIQGIEPHVFKNGPYSVTGFYVTTNKGSGFMPSDIRSVKVMENYAHNINDYSLKAMIHEHWLDLRHSYASTADKSQGSTFNKVFVDLNDMNACNQKDRLKRMLYVAITRAKSQVIFMGDIQI